MSAARKVTETRGLVLLRKWFRKNSGVPKAALASQLGVKPPAVFQWLRGTARPTAPFRASLADLLGIPEDAWLTPDERALAQRHALNVTARKHDSRGTRVQSARVQRGAA